LVTSLPIELIQLIDYYSRPILVTLKNFNGCMIWNWEEQGWNGLISDLTSVVSVTSMTVSYFFLVKQIIQVVISGI